MAACLASFYGAGKLDRTTVQQQFFRQRCLTSVRMRNDGESPPLADFILYIWHKKYLGFDDEFLGENGRIFAALLRLVVRGPIGHLVEALLLV